jgi:RNA polymerase sigma-70 factor (ECF subfamily)
MPPPKSSEADEPPCPQPDAAGAARVSEGDAGKLTEEVIGQYEAHATSLFRYAFTVTRSYDSARDAVHETFLRYVAARREGREIRNGRAWLFRVLRNYLVDEIRKDEAEIMADVAGIARLADASPNPEQSLCEREALAQVTEILTPREMECLRLRTAGLRYSEIADVMGVKPGTVGAILWQALNKVRRVLRNRGGRNK